MRGKDYQILKRAEIQARLKLPPDQQLTHPESGVVRALYDCPDLPLGPQGMRCRLVVATHPASERKSRVGVTRKASRLRTLLDQLTSGRFYRRRYRRALFASRRGRSMPEPPRTRSKTPTAGGVMPLAARSAGKSSLNGCGTRLLELGHQLHPDPVRTTEVAPAHLCELEEEASSPSPSQGYGPAEVALRRTRWPLLGTRLCSPAGWHAALWEQGSRLWRTSGAQKPTGACAWSLRPASAAVAPVLCGSSVNGMVPPPPSLVG